jgi:hypothetical protein
MAANRQEAPSLRSWRASDTGGVELDLEGAVAEISVRPDGSTRLRAAAGHSLPPDPGPGIGRDFQPPAASRPHPIDDGGFRIEHEGPEGVVDVRVEADPFTLRIRDRGGAILAELRELAFAADGRAQISLDTRSGEHFFGFGEAFGGLDKRGTRIRLRNRDPQFSPRGPMYVAIPFFLGLARGPSGASARGVLLESLAPSRFDVAASSTDRVVMKTDAGGIDVTIFPGPEPRDVVRRFTARVGRTPLPPLWALGHHQSRWSYASARKVRRLAEEIRSRGFPTDAIHLDIDFMDGFRVFTWNPKRFPSPKQLTRDLSEQGFQIVAFVDPGVKVDSRFDVFREGEERDVFCRNEDGSLFTLKVWPKDAALPDFNRDEVRNWWGVQHRPLLTAGVAGILNDMNEPAGWARELRLGKLIVPTRKQDLSNVCQSDPNDPERSVPHETVRNVYGLQQCRATRAALEASNPERRPFVLTRSGYAGIQRFAAVWTGDNLSRWSHLRQSIPMLQNLSLSGVAFCGADIGGFALPCSRELYARWIQLGALYPFARTHSMWGKGRQEPWSFGPRVEAIARAALELRMRLLPYLYGLFRETEETGAPVWRPLFYEFRRAGGREGRRGTRGVSAARRVDELARRRPLRGAAEDSRPRPPGAPAVVRTRRLGHPDPESRTARWHASRRALRTGGLPGGQGPARALRGRWTLDRLPARCRRPDSAAPVGPRRRTPAPGDRAARGQLRAAGADGADRGPRLSAAGCGALRRHSPREQRAAAGLRLLGRTHRDALHGPR